MIEEFYQYEPYELNKNQKSELLRRELLNLTRHHAKHCAEYGNILQAMDFDENRVSNVEDIPFLPVRIFKELDLLSVHRDAIFKTMTSSGTTGQAVSKIFLDKETAMMQQKVMVKILGDYWGKKRMPMLIVDSPAVVRNRSLFTARGAAMIGLRVMASDMTYVLQEDMTLDTAVLREFLQKNSGRPFVVFGFTFLVWQHFYKQLERIYELTGETFDFSLAWLMTGGGWKKLETEKISRDAFKQALRNRCGVKQFLDHYGMVEQTGCIYAECEYGHLHASIYSDVIPRRYQDLSPCEIGEKGILQVVSVLPHSYPGHSLLTEDVGMVLGEDDCPCGRKGKYIQILGRLKQAELRGCSDTYADKLREKG